MQAFLSWFPLAMTEGSCGSSTPRTRKPPSKITFPTPPSAFSTSWLANKSRKPDTGLVSRLSRSRPGHWRQSGEAVGSQLPIQGPWMLLAPGLNAPLLAYNPKIKAKSVSETISNRQVATTLLQVLGLPLSRLEWYRSEGQRVCRGSLRG